MGLLPRWAWLVLVAIGGLLLAYLIGRCQAPEPDIPEGYGPARIDTVTVREFLPSEPSIVERIRWRRVPAGATGQAPADTARVNEFIRRALQARDSTVADSLRLPPILPLMRLETGAERGVKIGLQRSDGMYVVHDFPACRHPCWAQTTGDGTSIEAREERQIPGLNLAGDLATCAVVGGAAGGVAWLAGYSEPVAVGALGGGGCVLLKVLF